MPTDIWKFDDAIKLLGKRRQLVIHRMPEGGHVFRLVLKHNAYAKLPNPFAFPREKRKKRRRPPSPWFLERGHRMDAGQHEGFAQIEVWAESATGSKESTNRDPRECRTVCRNGYLCQCSSFPQNLPLCVQRKLL
jgi:hypothetical protein